MNMSKYVIKAMSALTALSVPITSIAHPGHEPEDFAHAIAHELASPRGVLAIIILLVAASLWLYSRNDKK